MGVRPVESFGAVIVTSKIRGRPPQPAVVRHFKQL